MIKPYKRLDTDHFTKLDKPCQHDVKYLSDMLNKHKLILKPNCINTTAKDSFLLSEQGYKRGDQVGVDRGIDWWLPTNL